MSKRISALPEQTTLSGDEYVALDGSTNGTTKYPLSSISGGGSITVDSAMSSTSTNPVQNAVIYAALEGKASTDVATTSTAGLMSATDKANLDTVYADYSSALTALGVS